MSKIVPTAISQGIMFDITQYCRKQDQVSKIRKNSHTISRDVTNTVIYSVSFLQIIIAIEIENIYGQGFLIDYKHIWEIQKNSFITRE